MSAHPVSCIFHNDTDSEIGRGWEVSLGYKNVGQEDGGSCTTNIPCIQAHSSATITLPTEAFGKEVNPTSGVLEIRKEGLVFAGGKKIVNIVAGGEYHISVDNNNPPLTKGEYNLATQVLLDMCEGAHEVTLASYNEKNKQPAVWAEVVKAIGRDQVAGDAEAVEKVSKMITDGTCSGSARTEFLDLFKTHPRKPVLDTSVTAAEVQAALQQSKAKVVVYYRAVDRFPGGNCDSFVIKFTLNLETKKTTVVKWGNWDGSEYLSEAPISLPTLYPRFKDHVLPELCILAGEQKEGVNDSLLFTYTIDDNAHDSDEYNTEWTSIEILVYLPNQSDETKPVMHVHQYAVYPNWYDWSKHKATESVERLVAGPQTQKVVESLEQVFQMGRPEAFSEGESEIVSSLKKLKTRDLMWIGYITPVYLK